MHGALRVNARCVVIHAVHDQRLEYAPSNIGGGRCQVQIQPFAPTYGEVTSIDISVDKH